MSSESLERFVIGPQTRRRSFLLGLSGRGVVVFGIFLAAALIALVLTQSGIVLSVAAVLAVGLYVVLRIPPSVRSRPVRVAAVDWLRARRSARRSWAAFTPSASLPVPRPVGEILPLGVSAVEGAPEQLVIRHSPPQGTDFPGYFSTTVEIAGRGDGLWPAARHLDDAATFAQLLKTLAESAVHELSITVRGVPGLPGEYRRRVQSMTRPDLAGSVMADNTARLLDILEQVSDCYRMYATISIAEPDLARLVARTGPADPESLCQGVLTVLSSVVDRFDAAGLRVVRGMGPRRWAALVRHLYLPSWPADDTTGLSSAIDGFPPYPAALPDALRVADPAHDVVWHHATARVPPDAWPTVPLGPRWMVPLVAEMFDDREPSVIRTVTSSWRLASRRDSSKQVLDLLLADETQQVKEAGRVTTGAVGQQAGYSRAVLDDLRHHAAAVHPSLRVTCSAPSHAQLYTARDLVERSAGEMNLDRLEWMDSRQAEAMVWSLPLGRGLQRRWS